jgi:tetratricopeptide (TPR) repeat protein
VSGTKQDEAARLLKLGLNHYGIGDLSSAIKCWERTLEIEPGHRAARDYLESAYEDVDGSLPANIAPASEPSAPVLEVFDDDDSPRTCDALPPVKLPESTDDDAQLAEALRLYKDGAKAAAWEMLQEVARNGPERLDLQGYIAMMRSERAQSFARTVGDQGRVPRLRQTMAELMQLNLSPVEGFLLSQIDDDITIEQILNLSKDRVRTLEILAKFISEGLVE